jgi:glycosyltransferase involved in cell wall biosynthesis
VYEFGFVVEQVLGHATHARNLRDHVPDDTDVRAHWAALPYATSGGAARIPIYRSNWTVRVGVMARREIRRMHRAARLDALFFHTQVPATLNPDWLRRIPSVVSLDATPRQYDELGGFYEHGSKAAWLESLKLRASRRCFAAARHLVTWSEWAKHDLVVGYGVPEDKVTVVPPGVSVDDWSRPEPRHLHLGPVKLLFVGADLNRKGGLVLLEAFRGLRDLDVEVHFVTRDDVPAEPGVFAHHGVQPNSRQIRDLYHACDLFVLPTFGDCLPMVLSEAGAAGLATVSTQVGAIPEVIRDGETGVLVPPGDTVALGDALRRLIEQPDERLRMGERAIDHVGANYDTAINTRRLLNVMKQVASDRAGRVLS